MAADIDKRILYDILVSLEWPTERHDLPHEEFPSIWRASSALIKGWWNVIAQVLKYSFKSFLASSTLPTLVLNAVALRIPWQLSLNHRGDTLGIVRNDCVEVWSVSEDKDTVQFVGKCNIDRDSHPRWRKLAWSTQDALFAVSSSCGDVYLCGENGSVVAHLADGSDEGDVRSAYAGLTFVPASNYGVEGRADVLVSVTYGGQLKCYQVSGQFKLLHSFNFTRSCPHGVGAVLYNPQAQVLVVGGWHCPHGTAISCWRMLDGQPHYSKVERRGEEEKTGGLFSFLGGGRDQARGGIFHLALSPDGGELVGIDGNGQLTLWDMPSCRVRKSWSIDSQPRVDEAGAAQLSTDSLPTKGSGPAIPVDVNWWTEDAVIVAYSSGDVVVADLNGLANHLGSNPESCEPGCVVSPSTNGGFFVLERLSEVKTIPSAFSALASEEQEKLEGTPQQGAAARLIKQVLYYVTDAERFRPPERAAKAAYHTYRLVALQSTTPEELYQRKIGLEEYGEALELAKVYKLDADRVYMKQWDRNPMSINSIHDYLSKIGNTRWVLKECLLSVPADYYSAKELLRYGLSKTDFSHLVDLRGDDEDVMQSLEGDEDEEKEEDPVEIRRCIQSWGVLSDEQKMLCQHRLKLLQLWDRLQCYERVLGGVRYIEERYNREEFGQFREDNLLHLAVQYARASDAESLDVLMTVFGDVILPHWLPILSNFPETTPPSEYRDILPAESEDGVYGWDQDSLRSEDWCEDAVVMAMYHVLPEDLEEQNSGDFLYRERPDWINYRCEVKGDALSLWFQERSIEIEQLSGQVQNALSLVSIGVGLGMDGLSVVHHDLQTLSTLVYHCDADPSLSLHRLTTMTSLDKVQAMLRKVEPDDISPKFREHVLPFLCGLDSLEPGSGGQVLEDLLLASAAQDLTRCRDIVTVVATKVTLDKLTLDFAELMSVALQCIYTCDRVDQIDVAFEIIECLPSRSQQDSSSLHAIHDKVDELEDILDVARRLSKYNVKKNPQLIKNISNEPHQVEQVLTLFARTAGRSSSSLTEHSWREILCDMLHMQKVVFTCVDESTCYEIFALTLLCNGSSADIALASEILSAPHPAPSSHLKRKPAFSGRIAEERSSALVVQAAREYINSAASCSQQEVRLARVCLQLLGSTSPDALKEGELIRALELLDELGLEIIPIKIRMCEDKLSIVKDLLTACPKAYKQHKKVLELSRLLGLDSDEYEQESAISTGIGKTLCVLAQTSLEQNDKKAALEFCQKMVKDSFGGGWPTCNAVAMEIKATHPESSLSLLQFAILHCPPDQLESLLAARGPIEAEVLMNELSGEGQGGGKVRDLLGRSAETMEQIWSQGSGTVQQMMSYRYSMPSLTGAVSLMKSATSYLPNLPYLNQAEATKDDLKTDEVTPAAEEGSPTAHAQLHMADESLDGPLGTDVAELKVEIRPALHPFYETKGRPGRPKSYLTGHYIDLEKGLSVAQCLFRAAVISAHDQEDHSTAQVLLTLARESFSSDSVLALNYLLALPNPADADQLLHSVKASPFSLNFILYFLSLAMQAEMNQETKQSSRGTLFQDADKTIAHFVQLSSSEELEGSVSGGSEQLVTLMALFKTHHRKLIDCNQAVRLCGLGLGIDVGRFARDFDYKKETILSLAESVSEDRFSTSLSLASECELKELDVYVRHLKWLLCSCNLSAKKVRRRMTDVSLQQQLLKDSVKVAGAMKEEVYPGLNGRDIPKLIIFYEVLKTCCLAAHDLESSCQDAEAHLTILKKPKIWDDWDVDYKEEMSGKQLTPSQVFGCFVEMLFWRTFRREFSSKYWLKGCLDCLEKMSPVDVAAAIKRCTVSKQALELSHHLRIDVLEDMVRFLRIQSTKMTSHNPTTADNPDDKSRYRSDCQSAIKELDLCHKHLSVIQQNEESLYKLPPAIRLEFELSVSNPESVKELAVRLVLGRSPPQAVEDLLNWANSVQSHALSVKTLVVDLLSEQLATLGSSEDKRETLQSVDQLCSFCIQGDKGHVDLDRVTEVLLEFVQDSSKDATLRLEVLTLLEQRFPSSVVEPSLVMIKRSIVLVETHFNEQISPEDISSADKRAQLFGRLLPSSSSVEQLQGLAQILKSWPQTEDLSDQWCSLIRSALSQPHGEPYALYIRCAAKDLPVENDRALLDAMLTSTTDPALPLKYALIGNSSELQHEALQNFVSLDGPPAQPAVGGDGTLLELLVLRGLCADLVGSGLHDRLLRHLAAPAPLDRALFSALLDCPREQVEQRLGLDHPRQHSRSVAKQLYAAGRWVEAGAVAMAGMPHFHPSLGSLNTAFDFVTNWSSKS